MGLFPSGETGRRSAAFVGDRQMAKMKGRDECRIAVFVGEEGGRDYPFPRLSQRPHVSEFIFNSPDLQIVMQIVMIEKPV